MTQVSVLIAYELISRYAQLVIACVIMNLRVVHKLEKMESVLNE